MVTIKIEIGYGKEQKDGKKEFDIRKVVWLAAFADSVIWLFFGTFSLELFYRTVRYAYALSLGILFAYLLYLIIKARFLTKKYGRSAYRDEFGNTGLLLVAFSAVWLLVQCFFSQ